MATLNHLPGADRPDPQIATAAQRAYPAGGRRIGPVRINVPVLGVVAPMLIAT
jgi:hypothetical protein